MGNLGAEKAKNQGLGWQQGCGGGALVKAPEEKWGKMGKAPEENGEKWGEMGRKWGGNGEEMGGKGTGCTTQVSLFSPISPHFSPFPPHFPPFSPIFPHFPPFFVAMGTLWVRLWVQYPPPEPGTSEPCMGLILGSRSMQGLNSGPSIPKVRRNQKGYITPAFSGLPKWGGNGFVALCMY